MFRVTPHHRLATSLIKSIPPDAAVSAECSFIPHLAHRRHLYLFPIIKEARYIILDKTSTYIGPLAGQSYRSNYNKMLNHLLASFEYKLTHDEDGLKLFKKKP
ncbi:DUF2079 domain-containing protein [bacterium]|nr:DUF2079 domain-containing protein [bacterium]